MTSPENPMDNPWIPSLFTMSDEFKEKILGMAVNYPQAFKILPNGSKPEGEKPWAQYGFDEAVSLWIDPSHEEAAAFYQKKFSDEKEKTMTKALTVDEQKGVRSLLAANFKAINNVLPEHLTPERALRIAYTAIVKNPKIARCSQISLVNAVLESSMLGLEIGGPLALAHLIPYGNTVQLQIDYKGLIELMYRHPKVKDITAHPVYKNDEFSYEYGLMPRLSHIPGTDDNKGELVNAYAVVKFINGGFDFEVISKTDAMDAKSRSAAKNKEDSPWNKPKDEWTMWVKTAIRRLQKRIPKSPELMRAVQLDNELETGEGQNIKHTIDIDIEEPIDVSHETVEEKTEPNGKNQTHTAWQQPDGDNGSIEPGAEFPLKDLSKEDQKIMQNYQASKDGLPDEYREACKQLNVNDTKMHDPKTAADIMQRMHQIVDTANA